jgi:GNAT superfamily N-acetyltransferase
MARDRDRLFVPAVARDLYGNAPILYSNLTPPRIQWRHRNDPFSIVTAFSIRPLRADDSMDELTALVHRAFARLGRMGLHCTGVAQTLQTTAARARPGACFVALHGGRLAATMTLETPGPRRACTWYRRSEVASLHQFAVDPSEQGRGLGTRMLRFAERWVAAQHYSELALDTPATASHLLAFYEAHGFRRVDELRKPDKDYASVVLSKRVADTADDATLWRSPHRTLWCGALVPR